MGSLVEDAIVCAQWISTALESSGYRADFTGPSLWEVDRFFEENSEAGRPTPQGLLAEDLGPRLFALGGYLGEVIRRSVGGVWNGDDDDPRGEINISLVLPDGTHLWPVQRVMKRLTGGDLELLAPYAETLGVPVGPRPTG